MKKTLTIKFVGGFLLNGGIPMENGIVVNAETIQTIASVITALVIIFGAIFAAYRWYLKQNKQDEDIKALKKKTSILTKGVLGYLNHYRGNTLVVVLHFICGAYCL